MLRSVQPQQNICIYLDDHDLLCLSAIVEAGHTKSGIKIPVYHMKITDAYRSIQVLSFYLQLDEYYAYTPILQTQTQMLFKINIFYKE